MPNPTKKRSKQYQANKRFHSSKPWQKQALHLQRARAARRNARPPASPPSLTTPPQVLTTPPPHGESASPSVSTQHLEPPLTPPGPRPGQALMHHNKNSPSTQLANLSPRGYSALRYAPKRGNKLPRTPRRSKRHHVPTATTSTKIPDVTIVEAGPSRGDIASACQLPSQEHSTRPIQRKPRDTVDVICLMESEEFSPPKSVKRLGPELPKLSKKLCLELDKEKVSPSIKQQFRRQSSILDYGNCPSNVTPERVPVTKDFIQMLCEGKVCDLCNKIMTLKFEGVGPATYVKLVCSGECPRGYISDEHLLMSSTKRSGYMVYNINMALTYDTLLNDSGFKGFQKVCNALQFPSITKDMYYRHCDHVYKMMHDFYDLNLHKGHDAIKAYYKLMHPELIDGDIYNLIICIDGTYSMRGRNSRFGNTYAFECYTGISIDTSLVQKCIDAQCSDRDKIGTPCQFGHFHGQSGEMEVFNAKAIFNRSLRYNFRYLTYVSDGDAKVYPHLKDIYPGHVVNKQECQNHLYKNMSNSLYRYGYRWQPKPKPVVPDDPTEQDVPTDAPGGRGRRDTVSSRAASIGKGKGKGKGQNKPPPSPKGKGEAKAKGKGKAKAKAKGQNTGSRVKYPLRAFFNRARSYKLSQLFGLAVRQNRKKGTEAMGMAVTAIFYHEQDYEGASAIERKEKFHKLCGEHCDFLKWIKSGKKTEEYNRNRADGLLAHFSEKYPEVHDEVLNIFVKCSDENLMARCIKDMTQNLNESIHSKLWLICKKINHHSFYRYLFATRYLLLQHNHGYLAASMHNLFGTMTPAMKASLKLDDKASLRSAMYRWIPSPTGSRVHRRKVLASQWGIQLISTQASKNPTSEAPKEPCYDPGMGE